MVDIQSLTAEIRQGKKLEGKIEITGQKYNGCRIKYGGHKKRMELGVREMEGCWLLC